MRDRRMPRRGTRWAGTGLALSLLACGPAPDSGSTRTATDYGRGTHLVLLGTGTPNAEPERSGPAAAVVVDGRAYLVDAGPGIVRRAQAAARLGVAALAAPLLDIVFITHLHSDHTVGLADLIYTPWVLERTAPLRVYGPPGMRAMIGHLGAAYAEDVRVRIDGLEPANASGYQVVVQEVTSGLVYQDDLVRVTAFPVRHGSWAHAVSYRFDTRDQTIVISGDAAPSESIVEACDGCDLLVHEVYSQAGFARRPPEWQRYHAQSHTSTAELAAIARRTRPKLLILYHQLLWGVTPDELVAEIRAGWDGKVVFGNDLDVF